MRVGYFFSFASLMFSEAHIYEKKKRLSVQGDKFKWKVCLPKICPTSMTLQLYDMKASSARHKWSRNLFGLVMFVPTFLGWSFKTFTFRPNFFLPTNKQLIVDVSRGSEWRRVQTEVTSKSSNGHGKWICSVLIIPARSTDKNCWPKVKLILPQTVSMVRKETKLL